VLKDAIKLSLNATPESVSLDEVKEYLQNLKGVSRIHDIHVWSMSTTEIAMTGHLVMPAFTGDDAFLHTVCHELKERFGIGHATLQIERGMGAECVLEPDDVV
jgi:cobalt-zinc-cadmium efflux system protein